MFRSRGGACTSAPETATGAFGPGRKRPVAPAVPEWNSALGLEFRASAPPKSVAATGGPILGSRFRCSPQKRAVGRKYGPIVGLGPRPTPSPGVDATGWDGDPRTGWQEAYGIGLSGVEIHARYGVLCHRITWAATATGSPHPWVFFSLFVSRTGRDTRIRPISRSSFAARTEPDLDAASYDDSPRIGWQNAHGIGLSRVEILAPAGVLSQRVGLPVAATGRPIPGSHFRFSPQERGVARKYGPSAGLRPLPAPSAGVDAMGATAAHGPGPETPMESAFPRWQFVPGMGFCASAPPGLPPRRQASLLGLVVAVSVKNEPWTEM